MAIKSLLAAALAVPAMGFVVPEPRGEGKIVGGEPAEAGEFPSIVSLQLDGFHFCGGSLINSNTVLTAAHCSVDYPASDVTVRGGTITSSSGGKLVSVESITVHPNYDDQTFENDVAIWKLAAPIKSCSNGVAYATLAESGSDVEAGTELTVAGWGTLEEGGDSPEELMKVTVPAVSREDCNAAYSEGQITDVMFCAGTEQGGLDSCQGDSGGPIFDDATGVQVGVVSWGNGCARPGVPGVYARIGALDDFISANI
jgi:trypsin